MRISAAAYCDCHCRKQATLSTAVYIDNRMHLQGLRPGVRFLQLMLNVISPLQLHKVKRGSTPIVAESLRALWHGALARWTLDYAHAGMAKALARTVKRALRDANRGIRTRGQNCEKRTRLVRLGLACMRTSSLHQPFSHRPYRLRGATRPFRDSTSFLASRATQTYMSKPLRAGHGKDFLYCSIVYFL